MADLQNRLDDAISKALYLWRRVVGVLARRVCSLTSNTV